MAKFKMQLPTELIDEFRSLRSEAPEMFEEMTRAGAEVVKQNVMSNIQTAFKDASKLTPYLKITKTYRTRKDDGVNTKIGFYGYYKEGEKQFFVTTYDTEGYQYKTGKKHRQTRQAGRHGDIYQYNGIPVPLIIRAREFGSSSGEAKKPFFRKSFDKNQIENAMLQVQKKYIKED